MTVSILRGDCRVTLAAVAEASVHTCVTSPPYFGLRDYGTEPIEWPEGSYAPMAGLPACVHVPAVTCQLGLEPTIEAFIWHQILVFRAVRRVLRDDGTLWINMGDSYAGSWGAQGRDGGDTGRRDGRPQVNALSADQVQAAPRAKRTGSLEKYRGLKPKDLIGQPWRLAFALQADGWWLRQDVVWSKANPMPESIKDRCTKSHEYVLLLAKSERYYFDHAAIKEPASVNTNPRRGFKTPDGWDTSKGEGGHGSFHKAGREKGKYGPLTGQNDDGEHRTKAGLNRKMAEPGSGTKNNASFDAAMSVMPDERAKRSVWHVTTEAFSDAHFATFPTKLIEPCILAGCPEGGIVLDCFGGSGTTGVVADRLGRNAIVCELKPEYAAIAEKRLARDKGHVSRQRGLLDGTEFPQSNGTEVGVEPCGGMEGHSVGTDLPGRESTPTADQGQAA